MERCTGTRCDQQLVQIVGLGVGKPSQWREGNPRWTGFFLGTNKEVGLYFGRVAEDDERSSTECKRCLSMAK